MKIAVFGLGYVGSVTAACLAERGHDVTGVDISPKKVERIAAGESPVFEPGLQSLIAKVVEAGRLTTTVDATEALKGAEIIMICVGTPSRSNGSLSLESVERVVGDIGQGLKAAAEHPVVCLRSTVLPGTHAEVIAILQRESSTPVGEGFGFCFNPEFLREGTAIRDFIEPPMTVIGEWDPASGEKVAILYEGLPAPIYRVPLGVAEMVKYAGNAFHALKIVFANEIGVISQALDIDGRQVMDLFSQDTKLNISSRYLKPGFAYGGSCLGKDLRALVYAAREQDIDVPALASIAASNAGQLRRALDLILGESQRRVAVIGLSFKPGTDDLRESPMVELVERLIGKGKEVNVFDHEVSLASLLGTNKEFIEKALPHIASLLRPSLEEAIKGAGVVVYGKPLSSESFPQFLSLIAPDQTVVDLVGMEDADRHALQGRYRGIAW